MAYAGIDYGMGRTNIDHATGIRYGVISQHSVTQAWCDSSEPQYGDPSCPKCGNDVVAHDTFEGDTSGFNRRSKYGCADYVCTACEYLFDSEEVYGDEPQGYTYSDEGYELADCLDSDIMVLKSPYFTYAPFCSPCVPGAGNIDGTDGNENDGVKTYCLGHDWFEEGKAPYRVYSVETGKEVETAS